MYSETIKKIRDRKGLSQKDIASILDLENSTYCDYENEKQTLPLKYLIILSNYFEVSLDYLFNLTETIFYKSLSKEIDKTISGKRLKEFRKENKLTQEKIAEFLNTTHSVIADYERGRYLISTIFLYSICKKFNISADYLLGRIDNPKYIK